MRGTSIETLFRSARAVSRSGLIVLGVLAAECVAFAAEPVIEFHGYEVRGGEVQFSLWRREPGGAIEESWMAPGEITNGLRVRGFDPSTEIVQVVVEGRTIGLRLAGGRVEPLTDPAATVSRSGPETAEEIGRSRGRRLVAAGQSSSVPGMAP